MLFAEQGARDFETRAVTLAADVSAFVLKGGKNNLMDSGERGKLLNHIAQEMRILRGIAYGMNRAMYWAKMNGILRSLNPWATWQNEDVRIANDVINERQISETMKSKQLIIHSFAFAFRLSPLLAQQSTLDIAGMHQLIDQSKDENKLQVKARNQQALASANEQANLTLLDKLKDTYRTLQQRYNTLGHRHQHRRHRDLGYADGQTGSSVTRQQIVALAEKNPAIIAFGYQTEIEFAEKAKSLAGYVAGLTYLDRRCQPDEGIRPENAV